MWAWPLLRGIFSSGHRRTRRDGQTGPEWDSDRAKRVNWVVPRMHSGQSKLTARAEMARGTEKRAKGGWEDSGASNLICLSRDWASRRVGTSSLFPRALLIPRHGIATMILHFAWEGD